MRELYIRRRVPTMQKRPTLSAVTQVHYCYRNVRDLFIPINTFIDKRIGERGHDEDHRHSRIAKDALELFHKSIYYL